MNHYREDRSLNAIGAAGAVLAMVATIGIAVLLPMHGHSASASTTASQSVTASPHVGEPVQGQAVAARFRIDVIGSRKDA